MSEVARLVADLVSIDSVNPDLVPGGAGETEIVQFITAWGEQHGLETHRLESTPNRPSVVLVARGQGGGRTLMLNAHIDTVGVSGMNRPFEARIEGQRLYGRGAYDMKGGLAACLLTAARAAQLQLRGDVVVTCVADEEAASLGVQDVLREWRADAAIVTEPTGLDVCVAHKGFAWIEVETTGRAAHGSRPDLGVDAITKMGAVLARLENLEARLRERDAHPLLGYASVHASLIHGGQELSSYPQHCALSVERRTLPGETREDVDAEMQQLLAECAQRDPDFKGKARVTLVRDPFEVPETEEIVQLVRRHATEALGRAPRVYGETFWMDAAFLAASGIPTVVLGPLGAGAHAQEEWVDLTSVEECARILLNVTREFCA